MNDFLENNWERLTSLWRRSEEGELSQEEKKILAQLGTQLGTTDTQGQLSVLAVFNENIGSMIEKQTEKYAVKGKLCRSMGILAGAMAGILII